MANTPPFFRHIGSTTGVPSPVPERYPYHDNDECPIGLEIKASGEWQYYAPQQVAETRVRCQQCAALSRTA